LCVIVLTLTLTTLVRAQTDPDPSQVTLEACQQAFVWSMPEDGVIFFEDDTLTIWVVTSDASIYPDVVSALQNNADAIDVSPTLTCAAWWESPQLSDAIENFITTFNIFNPIIISTPLPMIGSGVKNISTGIGILNPPPPPPPLSPKLPYDPSSPTQGGVD
jgi:hypothetical protein